MAYSEKQIEETFTEICRQMAEEGKSLRKVLLSKDMPESHTFYKWIDNDQKKLLQYTRAHEDRVEVRFESIEKDYNEDPERNPDTNQIDNGWVNLQRLKIHSKQWELSKLNPKKYSDKIQVDTTEFSEQPLFPDVPKNDSNK
jgi:hypothetical protein